jgi:hypothetical protein
MPGPKQRRAPDDLGAGLIADVEVAPDGADLPPTDTFIAKKIVKTRLPEGGYREDEDRYWTKKGLQAWLSACPKAQVFIQLDTTNGEKNAETARPHRVGYDGIWFNVPKGKNVMVPLPIAQIVWEMQKEYRTAQSQGIELYTINPDSPEDRGYEIPAMAGAA